MPQLTFLVQWSAIRIRAFRADAFEFTKNIEKFVEILLMLKCHRASAFFWNFEKRASNLSYLLCLHH